MTQEYRSKTFKSGNSVALRLPKGLGIVEGREMRVREEHGRYIVEPVEAPSKKIDLSTVWGTGAGLKLLKLEDRVLDDRQVDPTGKKRERD
ncbi:MAG: AbrB/MazE/SpoVT family DNA-binding domain-containing protein [Sphingomicrobium sp.]